MKVFLALDIGSSSIRCAAYGVGSDAEQLSSPICSSSIKITSVEPNTGKIQLTGTENESLLDMIDESVLTVLKALREKQIHEVLAVGFSTFVMNLIAVDREGHVLGDHFTISYACNSRSVANECRTIRDELGDQRLNDLHQRTGAPIHSAYALAQLRELYSFFDKDETDKIFKWQSLASLCLSRWIGKPYLPISYSEASWTGLLNFRDCVFDSVALDLLPADCRSDLPPLADFTEYVSGIPKSSESGSDNSYWDLFPELRTSKLFLGVGDGACANIGSKCSNASRIAVTIGTSAAARICLEQGLGVSCSLSDIPKGLFCYRVSKRHVLVGGALTDGGSVVEWLSELLNLNTTEAFDECMGRAQEILDDELKDRASLISKSPNLAVVPFLSGERSTGFRDGATGVIMGLTRRTTSAHLMKSCLEGVSLRLKAVLELILQVRRDMTTCSSDGVLPCVISSGKSLEVNAMWRQMVADSSGLDVLFDPNTSEGTSRGVSQLIMAAMMSEERGTPLNLEEEALTLAHPVKPRAAAQDYFKEAALSQSTLIDAVQPLWNKD